jgi:hypothetical protein
MSIITFSIQLLDFPHLGFARSAMLSAICALSNNSGLHPPSLILQGVEREGECAVNGGSFADIWEGVHGNNFVAIKAMRLIHAHEGDKATKVSLLRSVVKLPDVLLLTGFYSRGRSLATTPSPTRPAA